MASQDTRAAERRALFHAAIAESKGEITIDDLSDKDLERIPLFTLVDQGALALAIIDRRTEKRQEKAQRARIVEEKRSRLLASFLSRAFGTECHSFSITEKRGTDAGDKTVTVTYRLCVDPSKATSDDTRLIIGALSYALVREAFGVFTYRPLFAHVVIHNGRNHDGYINSQLKVSGMSLSMFCAGLHFAIGIPSEACNVEVETTLVTT
jgi:hypothetical protein